MFNKIKSDTYRSRECIWKRLDGVSLLWSCGHFFWWATLNLKHWCNIEATHPWDAKCLSLTIWFRLLVSRKCRHWIGGCINFSQQWLLHKFPKLFTSETTDVLPQTKTLVKKNKKNQVYEKGETTACRQRQLGQGGRLEADEKVQLVV